MAGQKELVNAPGERQDARGEGTHLALGGMIIRCVRGWLWPEQDGCRALVRLGGFAASRMEEAGVVQRGQTPDAFVGRVGETC